MAKITGLPAATEVLDDDLFVIASAAGLVSESVKMRRIGIDRVARWELRDDFVPSIPIATYVDSGAAFLNHTDNVSNDTFEGHGFRNLQTSAASSRDMGGSFSGGPTDLIVRARFRIQSTIANIGVLKIGAIEASGISFGATVGVTAAGFLGANVQSVAGGLQTDMDDSTVPVLSEWREIELRLDFNALTATVLLDGVIIVIDKDVTGSIPEDIETMGLGYSMAPTSGTGEVEIDYIEVQGKRW